MALDALPVDERAIGATKVDDHETTVALLNSGVAPRDEFIPKTNIAIGGATNRGACLAQGISFSVNLEPGATPTLPGRPVRQLDIA
jgi:hypothetical protein